MKKSTWVIEIVGPKPDYGIFWKIRLRSDSSVVFEASEFYSRRDSALRGARRMAKRLRINADVE